MGIFWAFLLIIAIALAVVFGPTLAPVSFADPAFQAPGTDEDGPDILRLSLITSGAIIGAAVLGLALNFLRQRIGYTPHPPPEARREQHHSQELDH